MAKAFTSGEFTTANCQSRSARLVREAIDRPRAVTNATMTLSCTSGISESIAPRCGPLICRSSDCETEHAAASRVRAQRKCVQ
jgi:hypothetical protein